TTFPCGLSWRLRARIDSRASSLEQSIRGMFSMVVIGRGYSAPRRLRYPILWRWENPAPLHSEPNRHDRPGQPFGRRVARPGRARTVADTRPAGLAAQQYPDPTAWFGRLGESSVARNDGEHPGAGSRANPFFPQP